MPMFTRRSRARTFQMISAGCRRMDSWLSLPRTLLFLETLRLRDAVGSEWVAAVCSGFCARSWVSWRKLQRSHCEHWPFAFHWQQIPFPPPTAVIPFRLFIIAPDSILPCLASQIRNRSFWSLLLFTIQILIVGNRYLLMNFHVVQFLHGFELIRLTYS